MRKLITLLVILLATLNPTPAPADSLLNLSTRVEIPAPFLGENVTSVIGGFIIGGNISRKVLIRAIGPSLANFGLVPLADPTLELYDAAGLIVASNDNWMDTQEQEIIDTGLEPSNALESAILITLAPGTYTAIIQGNDLNPGIPVPTNGTALFEIYDVSVTVAEGLDNISTRGAVQGAADPMIAGFIVAESGNLTVVIRAVGPSLQDFGLAGLSDPRLDLFDSEGNIVASNDNWQDSQSAEIEATGLAPSDPLEAAILINLSRGAYTAVLSPTESQAHGTALAELYKVE
jgi:hypothetical protein